MRYTLASRNGVLLCRDLSRFLPKLNAVEQQTCLRLFGGGATFRLIAAFGFFPFAASFLIVHC
jgi:hypothetical protein